MSFFSAFAILGIVGTPILALAALIWSKSSTMGQSISDAERLSGLAEKFGVPLLLLIFTGFVMWRLAKWARPKADKLIDTTLAKADALPQLLKENLERDAAAEVRQVAMLHALERLSDRIEVLTEIIKAQK